MAIAATLPRSRTRAIWLLALFAAVQFADASLTLAGVRQFGPAAEGNPILAFYIAIFGVAPVLLAAKSIAVLLATAIYARAHYLAVAVLTLFYVLGAIDAWALVRF